MAIDDRQGKNLNKMDLSASYIRWNSWDSEPFASLNKTMRGSFDAEIKKTGRKLPVGSNVLEVGFGNGGFLRYAEEKNWCVTGTEINEILVSRAAESGFHVICESDLSNLKVIITTSLLPSMSWSTYRKKTCRVF